MGKGFDWGSRGAGGQPTADLASQSTLWRPKGLVAVLDASTLVAARLARVDRHSSSRDSVRLAGTVFDSFTSPAIVEEVEIVLARPKFGFTIVETRRWLDVFVRHSRQVDPGVVPGEYTAALHGDVRDNPVLKTALAVNLHEEGQGAIAEAGTRYGCFIVSWDKHFEPGWNLWGWQCIRPDAFLALLHRIA